MICSTQECNKHSGLIIILAVAEQQALDFLSEIQARRQLCMMAL